jgi:hypothetical protein
MSSRARNTGAASEDGSPLLIDGADLALDLRQMLSGLAFEQTQRQNFPAIGRRRSVLDQCTARGEQFSQLVDRFVFGGGNRRAQRRAEAGQHGGIHLIRFGTSAGCLGEAAGLQRIDFDRWQAGFAQSQFQQPVVGTGGLEDDTHRLERSGPGYQAGVTFTVVGELADVSAGQEASVEGLFRDVDADGDFSECRCC